VAWCVCPGPIERDVIMGVTELFLAMDVNDPNLQQPDSQSPTGRLADHAPRLCPKSARAVDALVDRGFDAQHLADDEKSRCDWLSKQLAGLKQSQVPPPAGLVGEEACLIKRTMQKIAGQRNTRERLSDSSLVLRLATATNQIHEELDVYTDATLSEFDLEAIDVLAQSNWNTSSVPGRLRLRAEALQQLLGNLQHVDLGQPQERRDRIDRVVAAIESQPRTLRLTGGGSRAALSHADLAGDSNRRGFKLLDVVGIAAMVLVGASVLWPTFQSVRASASQSACSSRQAGMAMAFGQYSTDNRASLPMATASIAGTTWWNVGTPKESNSANLFTLARTGYSTVSQLTCCGNPDGRACRVSLTSKDEDWQRLEEVSYSFRNMFAHERPTMNTQGRWVVLADRSPVVIAARRGDRVIFVNQNSPNHGGRGQNILFNDGSSQWTTTPVVDGDNIWLPGRLEAVMKAQGGAAFAQQAIQPLRGVEEPTTNVDAFVCP
jgi:hypothetical protein